MAEYQLNIMILYLPKKEASTRSTDFRNILLESAPSLAVIVFNGCRLKGLYTIAKEKWQERRRSGWVSPRTIYTSVRTKCRKYM